MFAGYWDRIYIYRIRILQQNSIWRKFSSLLSDSPITTPISATYSPSNVSSSHYSYRKKALYVAIIAICIQLSYLLGQMQAGNTKNNVFNVLSSQQSKGIYTCHPPTEQLLVGKSDISQSPVFESASKWADNTLGEIVAMPDIDSLSFTVFGPSGDPVYQNRVGTLRGNESNSLSGDVNQNTLYRVASITKVFTVMELLHLRDEGLLNFDEDISKYLDDFDYPSQTWRERLGFTAASYNPATDLNPDSSNNNYGYHEKITIRQLISHLSGLLRDVAVHQPWPILNGGKADFEIPEHRLHVLETIKNNPPLNTPSSIPIYSNLAFNLAEYIIEQVYRQSSSSIWSKWFGSSAKISFDKIIQKDILEPLNMTSSFFDIPTDKKYLLAVPSSSTCGSWADRDLRDSNGAFGLSTSMDDLRKFSQAILSNYHGSGSGEDGPLPISPSTIREWLRPTYTFDDSLTAIGAPWEIYNYPPPVQSNDKSMSGRSIQVYTKVGFLPGYLSYLILDPSRQFGAILLVTGSGSVPDISHLVKEISTKFGAAFSEYRGQLLSPAEGKYCLSQDLNLNFTSIIPGSAGSSSSELEIQVMQDSLWVNKWSYWGTDMLKVLELDAITQLNNKPRVALWPSSERGVYRAGTGRPPLNHFEGCSKQLTNLAKIISNGFPMDLVSLTDDEVHIPGGQLIYSKKNC